MHTLSNPLHSGSLSWLPLLHCCAPPCLLCSPSSLLVWLPRSVCLCCSSPCMLVLLGAPFAHPLLSHPPPPRARISRLHPTLTVPQAVGWSRPYCHPRGGHLPAHCVQPPPLWSSPAPHIGRGMGGLFADGSLGVCRIWWLLQCSHLMVPLCIVVCRIGARPTAVCGAALCPIALLRAFLPIWCSFFFCWRTHCCWGACRSLPPLVAVGWSHCDLGGTRGTGHFSNVSTCANWSVTGVCWGCSVVNVMRCCSCAFWAAEGLPASGLHSGLSTPRS